jgi:exosortase
MWSRDHYQFFPLIIVGFVWLIWERVQTVRWPPAPVLSVRVILYLLFSAALFGLAFRTRSHWVGLLAFLAALWTSVWYAGGKAAADQFRGPMFFLILLIPFPLNLDLQCIIGLQKIAAQMASGVLDLLSQRHTVSGVVLRIPEKRFMVEEACSGVHSLFSAVSALIFFGVYSRYSLIRLILTVIQTSFWVLAANGLRVFLIVYCFARWRVSLDTGWLHDALGVFTYVLALACAVSTDQLLRFIFPVSEFAVHETGQEIWRKLNAPFRRLLANLLDRPSLSGKPAIAIPAALMLILYVPLGVMALEQLTAAKGTGAGQQTSMNAGAFDGFQEGSLPEFVGAWRRSEFRMVRRDPGDLYGLHSAIWGYEGYGIPVALSIDGFYSEWHDLAYCYTASGWQLQESQNFTIRDGDLEIPHTRVLLYKKSGEMAVVYFSCFDSQGTPVTPGPASGSILRTLRDRLFSAGFGRGGQTVVDPPVFQVQLLVEARDAVFPDEMKMLEQLFREVRRKLRSDFLGSRN